MMRPESDQMRLGEINKESSTSDQRVKYHEGILGRVDNVVDGCRAARCSVGGSRLGSSLGLVASHVTRVGEH